MRLWRRSLEQCITRFPAANLVESLSVGSGGAKVGVGIGRFVVDYGSGWALRLTGARTYKNPLGAQAGETLVGLEAECTFTGVSIRVGPLVQVGGLRQDSRPLGTWDVGIGFF